MITASPENSLAIPEVGTHTLRLISPSVLELTLVTTKAPDPGRVEAWDFGDGQTRLPTPSDLAATADGEALRVEKVGFKRRALYAPLNRRDLRIASTIYLQLLQPIRGVHRLEVKRVRADLWPESVSFACTNEPGRRSPAIHVNQVGYTPAGPKRAMIGYYLGTLGELPIDGSTGFQLIDSSNQIVFTGPLLQRPDEGYTYQPSPYQEVWEADFTAFSIPGDYRLLVPGLGTSYPFRIDDGVAGAFTRAYALGIFHQRCGMAEEVPFTRFVHAACHTRLAEIPDLSYAAVNQELANMSGDFARYQTAPQLQDVSSSLYPFIDTSPRDVAGGHHDAGDYSKYTINSAGFIHFLVFAADAFPGAGGLDNLGIPESGDGRSDLLQEAKWEADFLSKLQDTDGGFYFLVYPRDREYEQDVLPDDGDSQVVFPKTTAVTAAAVAALAEAGSSPRFKEQFPQAAGLYLQKAVAGWQFLERALARYGKAGAYQKITHYGNEFGHDDELAWAAAALFTATGDQRFHRQLKSWFDPADRATRRWTWWRMFEGYGCAVRTYAFASRSGRLNPDALDPEYLAKCQAEIVAAADDQARFAQECAYGTSFPDPNKAYQTAGWYFSSERAFDLTVAYQLQPRPAYEDAVWSNVNYEAGGNPVNVTYITGLGWQRQREIVHQYAQNDQRVLPPSGLPIGNVQAGSHELARYQRDVAAVTVPSDGVPTAPYPFYDRWCDTFNTTTEFVIMDQARSLASLSFWMARSSLKFQAWRAAAGQITGLPGEIPAEESITLSLAVPGLDVSQAQVVWEATDQEPVIGSAFTFAAKSPGAQWVEVEAQWPDGRRVVATGAFTATASLHTPPNGDKAVPQAATSDVVALFNFDADASDVTGQHGSLRLAGNAALNKGNLSWMAERTGSALRCDDLGDEATLDLPDIALRPGGDLQAIILEAMICIDALVAYNRNQAPILSLYDGWDAFLEFGEDKYAGPYFRGGSEMEWLGSPVGASLTRKQWHHLALEVNRTGYAVRIDGQVVRSQASNQLANWGRGGAARLRLGNFAGWLDEVIVRTVRLGPVPSNPPSSGGDGNFKVVLETPDSGSTGSASGPGSTLLLRISGKPGNSYMIEWSRDLVLWQPLSTNRLASSEASLNLGARTSDRSFYRIRNVVQGGAE